MTTVVIWLIRNWHLSALALTISFAAGLWMRLDSSQQTVLALNTKIAEANQVAAEYQEASEKNLETLRTSLPLMVEQAQANAVRNYKSRYPTRPVACGTGPAGLLPSGSTATTIDPADSSLFSYDPGRQFLVDCASDAARLVGWQEWARLNKLPVK